jgi:hypothetical protein
MLIYLQHHLLFKKKNSNTMTNPGCESPIVQHGERKKLGTLEDNGKEMLRQTGDLLNAEQQAAPARSTELLNLHRPLAAAVLLLLVTKPLGPQQRIDTS